MISACKASPQAVKHQGRQPSIADNLTGSWCHSAVGETLKIINISCCLLLNIVKVAGS